MSFNDKVVIVTGASSGIGAAIAIKFAQEGAKVALVGRNQDKLKNVASKCGKPLVIVADVTKDADCKRIVSDTIAQFGQLDVLVNNAGIGGSACFKSEDAMQVFDKTMATNLRSAVYITHLAKDHVINTKGNVINISSIAAFQVIGDMVTFAYHTSKAALDHFTRSVASELASDGVRVNTVNPGPVWSDIFENAGSSQAEMDALWEQVKNKTALKRVSEPEEVADLVLFLASEKAKGITGSSLLTDNGWLVATK